MEVVIPTRAAMDFDFNSARSSPCVTAPSTPRRFGDYYMSAPTSPSRMSEFYREFGDFNNWEDNYEQDEAAATPKSTKSTNEVEFGFYDFAFDVSEEKERTSLSAEELFDGGVIRPFKPPPATNAPRSPSFFRQVLSPRRKKDKHPPFQSTSSRMTQMENPIGSDQQQNQRGRDRAPAALSSSVSGRRTTRSLSPLRVSEYQWEEEEKQQKQPQQTNKQLAPKAMFSCSTPSSASKASRKWKLKDFLLFRSASEGRATDKDPFRKYSALFKKNEDIKMNTSSFRSIESPASVSSSRRRAPVSAHELHYTVNKAVSDDLKKKTFLPYKQGILGRLAFNPAVSALANGFGSLSRT